MFSNSASSHSRKKIVTFELIEKPCECAFERGGRVGWYVLASHIGGEAFWLAVFLMLGEIKDSR